MFGLIPLVATIILATIVGGGIAYYGGEIFSGSSIQAESQQVVNEGDQIYTAIKMYRLDNGELPDDGSGNLDLALILGDTRYYNGTSTDWSANSGGVGRTMANEQACLLVNERQGYSSATVPSCASIPAALNDAKYYCCTP